MEAAEALARSRNPADIVYSRAGCALKGGPAFSKMNATPAV
jgi:hypothetical protein